MGKLFQKNEIVAKWQNFEKLENRRKIEKILRMKSRILIGGLSLVTVGTIILCDYYRRKSKRKG